MPRIPKRAVLEENGELVPRQSRLLDAMEGKDENRGHSRSRSLGSRASTSSDCSRSPGEGIRTLSVADHDEDDSRNGSRNPSQARSDSPVGSDGRFRSRSRSISPDRVS